MKKILGLIVAAFVAVGAQAQSSSTQVINSLVGLGMAPELANYLGGVIPPGAGLDNGVWLKGDNAAGSGTINLLRLDSGDNTVINSSASDELILQLEDDANRLLRFTAASDTAINLAFGDSATANQVFSILGSMADAADSGTLQLASGGAATNARGAYLFLAGNEASGSPGDVTLAAGNATDGDVIINVGSSGGDFIVNNGVGLGAALSVLADDSTLVTGSFTSSATGSLGWSVVDGTDNTACTAQCTSAAVFGLNLSAGATAPNMVGPSDATADICLCAGAS